MRGTDVGIQMTLQSHHSVLGHQPTKQREVLGLPDIAEYALILVVPPERFDTWKSFQNLSWKDDADGKVVAGGVKRRRVSTERLFLQWNQNAARNKRYTLAVHQHNVC